MFNVWRDCPSGRLKPDYFVQKLPTPGLEIIVQSFFGVYTQQEFGYISGTTSITISQSGTLTGKGSLSASSSITVSQSATLNGLVYFSGTSSVSISQSGSVSGLLFASGTSSIAISTSGNIIGNAYLSATSGIDISNTASITGYGYLISESVISIDQSGAITGMGYILGSVNISLSQSGIINGEVNISGNTGITISEYGTIASLVIGYCHGYTGLHISCFGYLFNKIATSATIPVTPIITPVTPITTPEPPPTAPEIPINNLSTVNIKALGNIPIGKLRSGKDIMLFLENSPLPIKTLTLTSDLIKELLKTSQNKSLSDIYKTQGQVSITIDLNIGVNKTKINGSQPTKTYPTHKQWNMSKSNDEVVIKMNRNR
jgi:hypothetical protein